MGAVYEYFGFCENIYGQLYELISKNDDVDDDAQ